MAPIAHSLGTESEPVGGSGLRVDMKKRSRNLSRTISPAPRTIKQQNGLNRPSDVLFGPDARLYIVDWGASTLDEKDLMLSAAHGRCLARLSRQSAVAAGGRPGDCAGCGALG